jgi:hypothetical protein
VITDGAAKDVTAQFAFQDGSEEGQVSCMRLVY